MTQDLTATMKKDNQLPQAPAASERGKATKKTRRKSKKKAKPYMWSFPSRCSCPRCGATDTVAYSTYTTNEMGRQYRKCVRAVCRHTFSVNGDRITKRSRKNTAPAASEGK